jgi:hypothetical protein
MQLSLRLSFHLRHSLGGYTVGTTTGFWVKIMEDLAPQTSPLNPAEVPTVAYEHLFCLPLRGHFFCHPLKRKTRGATVGVKYPSTMRRQLRPMDMDMIDSL